jgi:hypothetical protein
MTAGIFLVTCIAMMMAVAGRRDIAVGLFAIVFIASVVWLNHHMTSSLTLSL